MQEQSDILFRIRIAAEKKLLFLPHALRQMLAPERMIRNAEVRKTISHGEVIEDYPNDPRGHSCLVLGGGDENRPLHVVCAPKEDYLAIITAYLPDDREWSRDFKERVRK